MKKIFSIIILFAAIAACFTGCNNKPPFVRLAEAVDSLNTQFCLEHNTEEKLIDYDKFENRVNFNLPVPMRIDDEAFAPIAEHIKQNFLLGFVTDNEFNIATEAIDAKANVVICLHGEEDTTYEILITTNELEEAYKALHPDASGSEPAPETAEEADLQQEQRELTEGDVTTVE